MATESALKEPVLVTLDSLVLIVKALIVPLDAVAMVFVEPIPTELQFVFVTKGLLVQVVNLLIVLELPTAPIAANVRMMEPVSVITAGVVMIVASHCAQTIVLAMVNAWTWLTLLLAFAIFDSQVLIVHKQLLVVKITARA